jgi:stress response protein YsnF
VATQGFFDDVGPAEAAKRELLLAGFREDQLQLSEGGPGILGSLLGDRQPARISLTVAARGRGLEAAAILHRYGAIDPEAEPESDGVQSEAVEPTGGEHLELVVEDLVPRRVVVEIGGARIRKRVVSTQRSIQVEVRREELLVEREEPTERIPHVRFLDPEDPLAEPQDLDDEQVRPLGADDEVMRVPLLAEQIVVSKRPYIVEEVLLRKRRVAELRQVVGEVRREELEVEGVGNVTVEDEGGDVVVRPSQT